MFFALWDLESGNLLGDFDAEGEALAVIRDLLDANAPDYAEVLSLERTEKDGRSTVVSDGLALAALARSDGDSSRRSV